MPEEVGQCIFCHYETNELFDSKRPPGSPVRDLEETQFCKTCYSTLASTIFWYSTHYSDGEIAILRSISYATNMLLAALAVARY